MDREQFPFDAPVLRWGIKRSFISYLSRLPDGSVSAEAGASIVSGSYFQFEPDGGASAAEAGAPAVAATAAQAPAGPAPARIHRFRGQVRLSGHHGMMSLFVADPWLEYGEGGAVLSVADPRQAQGSGVRLELLRLVAPGEAGSAATGVGGTAAAATALDGTESAGGGWTELPARLARAAVELFNGQYPAGEEMDPVFLGPA